jgi:glycosyltransferase involved in cell wall biosynthesis
MRICVTTELRIERTPDGAIWTKTAMSYDFWRRYLTVFDEVRVIARVHDVCEADTRWRRADGEQVKFFPLPYYVGASGYIRKRYRVARAVRAGISRNDAIIFRVSSPIAACARPLVRNGRPHGLEVIGDPYEVYAPGSVDHPFRPFFRVWFSAQLRRQCRAASAVAFVTEHTLQHRYPPSPTGFATHYSSVELPEAAFVPAPKRFSHSSGALVTIVSVGSMEQPYKGFDVLIDALARCLQRGLQLELVLVGDGRYRKELIQQTMDLGIADAVTFRGNLPAGPSVRAELDRAHIFVLVSKTEGLPRAMI